MSTRTIASPGVQINEVDLSLIARPIGATNTFITGFASQGPTDEIINVGSISEYEEIFGSPTNASERYLYHSARQLLTQSPTNLLVTRMPYGSGAGAGFSNQYTALVYPLEGKTTTKVAALSTFNGTIALSSDGSNSYPVYLGYDNKISHSTYYISPTSVQAVYNNTIVNVISGYTVTNTNLSYKDSTSYNVLSPKSILLSDQQYLDIVENNITWGNSYSAVNIKNFGDLQNYGGIVVIDSAKTSVNNLYEGYYIAISDNSNHNPATDFTCITSVKAGNTLIDGNYQTFVTVPSARLNFTLTQSFSAAGNSISQIVEQFPRGIDFGTKYYTDCLTLMVFKLRTSIYAQDTVVIDAIVAEGYTGSLYSKRTQNNRNGGPAVTFFLEELANRASNTIKVVINPYISNTGDWVNDDGLPAKTVRTANETKSLFSQGVYISDTNAVANDVGNVPAKLQRILNNIENLDIDLDVTAEAGLGTIWTGAKARWKDASYGNSSVNSPYIYDETYNVDTTVLKDQTNNPVGGICADYKDIANQFIAFADNTRKDHVFIADPLKYIFIQGADSKVSRNANYVFSSDTYWPLKNLYAGSVSSYAAVYGNWIKTNDTASNKQVWIPSSGYVAAVFATSSQIAYPWSAPAGFNRGVLTNLTDVGINPTQKQRDLLARINVNPIGFFPGDAFVIFGQKTLFTKPSAFDRINVRRLFLSLEKTTESLLKFYVFEPNTFTTRSRLVNGLAPIFNQAKNNDGLYDYRIVCDERNNTPDVIDNNELRLSIYIQPVRTAEFILADFIATRTGVDFNELIR
jgi:hypothetical protein